MYIDQLKAAYMALYQLFIFIIANLFSFLNELVFQENLNCAVLSLCCQKSAFYIFATHHRCLQ